MGKIIPFPSTYQDAIPPADPSPPPTPPRPNFPPPSGENPPAGRRGWFILRNKQWCVSVRAIPASDGERVTVIKKNGDEVLVQLGRFLSKEGGWYLYEFFVV